MTASLRACFLHRLSISKLDEPLRTGLFHLAKSYVSIAPALPLSHSPSTSGARGDRRRLLIASWTKHTVLKTDNTGSHTVCCERTCRRKTCFFLKPLAVIRLFRKKPALTWTRPRAVINNIMLTSPRRIIKTLAFCLTFENLEVPGSAAADSAAPAPVASHLPTALPLPDRFMDTQHHLFSCTGQRGSPPDPWVQSAATRKESDSQQKRPPGMS